MKNFVYIVMENDPSQWSQGESMIAVLEVFCSRKDAEKFLEECQREADHEYRYVHQIDEEENIEGMEDRITHYILKKELN